MFSLETVLNAAVNSMIHGHHKPHCYRAHVQGEGYINEGLGPVGRADYLAQLERTARAEIANMGWAERWAGKGYTQPKRGILMADWNCLPRGLDSLLERMGYECVWNDETSTCDHCNNALQTEPDCYSWEPDYKIEHGGITCLDCVEEEEETNEE